MTELPDPDTLAPDEPDEPDEPDNAEDDDVGVVPADDEDA